MEQAIGYCKHCGQAVSLDRDLGSEEKNNDAASLLCNCPPARDANHAFARRQRQIEQAKESIKDLFVRNEEGINLNAIDPDITDVVTSLLEKALTPIVDKQLWKVSIEITGGVKASISRSGKDKITVERTDGIKRKMES